MNFVYTLKDSEQYFNLKELRINYLPFFSGLTNTKTTCVDKIFAIREMRLNPYIGFAQYAGGTGTDPISKLGTMIDSEFSSAAAFCVDKPEFTSHNQIQIYLK